MCQNPPARVRGWDSELGAQQVHRLFKARLAGGAVEQKKQPPGIDLVEVVLVDAVGEDIPGGSNQRVEVVPDRFIIASVAGLQPDLFDGLVDQPVFVMPAVGHSPLEHRIDHAHRPCLGRS